MKWIRKKIETLFSNRWRTLETWTMQAEGGDEKEVYIHAMRGFVVVFALTKDKQVLVLREYFFGTQRHVTTLVAGSLNDSEDDPLVVAQRELKEEAGHASDKWTSLGAITPNKYTSGEAHFFLAEDVYHVSGQVLEDIEDIEVQFMSLEAFRAQLVACTIEGCYDALGSYLALDHLQQL